MEIADLNDNQNQTIEHFRPTWDRISIQGWKSIRDVSDLKLNPVNILIGANAAGKSNLISFFEMLSSLADENLQHYIKKHGGANNLLHCGAKNTSQISSKLRLAFGTFQVEYSFRLIPDVANLLFLEDEYKYGTSEFPPRQFAAHFGTEPKRELISRGAPGSRGLLMQELRSCLPYHFRDTSETARMRQHWNVDDSARLKEDAANIAPFLFALESDYPNHYRLIVETIQQILPFFLAFEFNPSNHVLMLQWRERNSDIVYSAYQASDGMLRVIALVALLLQPADKLPSLLILDEPELGLHPFAIDTIAGLIRSVSTRCQVIVATQSETFLDRFEPSEVIVVERSANGESEFKRLNEDDLRGWLSEYSLSELWEKNVIGGRPK